MAPTVKPGIGYIDAIITKVALCTLPTWRAAGFTPNGLTTLGLVCTVATLAATYRALLGGTAGADTAAFVAAVFLALRAYFDYADGLMARKFGMTTDIGGWYDHVVDWFFVAGFTAIIAKYDWRLLFLLVPLYATVTASVGCMEDQSEEVHGSLSGAVWLCRALRLPRPVLMVLDNGFLYVVMAAIIVVGTSVRGGNVS